MGFDPISYLMGKAAGGGGGGGGGGGATLKQVSFIDYDGTLLHSYTKEEANALTSLPANPSHDGLASQGWNWTLAEIKAQLTAIPDGPIFVGQMYVTQSGDTEIEVRFDSEARLSPILTIAVNGTITVDWGDNTTADTVTGSSLTTRQAVPHTYSATGDYTITIHVVSGEFAFYGDSSYQILRKNTTANENRVYSAAVKAVRLGTNITSIGRYAFSNCGQLEYVTMPSTVTSIGTYAFVECYNLKSVAIPSSATSVDANAFTRCYSLENISIPVSVTSIPNAAFNYCYSLPAITIPYSVTSLGNNAFDGCYSLSAVFMPSSGVNIGKNTFSGCSSLESLVLPDGITSIGEYAISNCNALKKITIPTSVTTIDSYAFSPCYSLPSVTIPEGVTKLGASAFANCYGMGAYHLMPTTPPTISANTFSNIPSDCIIYVPAAALDTYKAASGWSSYASRMVGE